MPPYDLTVIVRTAVKNDVVGVMKRVCTSLLEHGAVIEKLDSFGYRDLPFKMKKAGKGYFTGNYFQLRSHMSIEAARATSQMILLDDDVLKTSFEPSTIMEELDELPPCSLWDEMRHPAYRSSVQERRRNKRYIGLPRRIIEEKLARAKFQEPVVVKIREAKE